MIPNFLIDYSNNWMIFIKALKNKIQMKNKIFYFFQMIRDMHINQKTKKIVNYLFIRGKKSNISVVSITQSYCEVPKIVRLNTTYFFVMKIPNKRELEQTAYNRSSHIDFKDFMDLYKNVLQNHILF